MQIGSYGIDPRFESLRGLVAGSCAEIEEPMPGRKIEQRHDSL
jgi:hypothetical protein